MIPPLVIVIVLSLLLCAGGISLWLDGRERRMDHQVVKALPTSHSASLPSIRRLGTGSQWGVLHRLANYRAAIAYT